MSVRPFLNPLVCVVFYDIGNMKRLLKIFSLMAGADCTRIIFLCTICVWNVPLWLCSNYFFLFLLKSYIKDFFDPDKIEFHQLHDIIGNKIFLIFVKRGLCSNYFFFNPIEIWYTILFWVWIFYSFIIYITLLVAKKFLHGNCGLCSNYFF